MHRFRPSPYLGGRRVGARFRVTGHPLARPLCDARSLTAQHETTTGCFQRPRKQEKPMTTETIPQACDRLLVGAATVTRMADWLADHPRISDLVTYVYGGTNAHIQCPNADSYQSACELVAAHVPEGVIDSGDFTPRPGATFRSFAWSSTVTVLVIHEVDA